MEIFGGGGENVCVCVLQPALDGKSFAIYPVTIDKNYNVFLTFFSNKKQ